MGKAPRRSFPGSIWKLTAAVTTREFMLRPDEPIGWIFSYLLAHYAERYSMEVHPCIVMSNHPHLMVTDVLGDQLHHFNRSFFSMLARVINEYREREGNLFDPDGVDCVEICPRSEDLVHHGAYISLNAVVAGLVPKAKQWPGETYLPSDMGTLEKEITRPPWLIDPDGDLPEKVTLRITVPKAVDCTQEELRERMIAAHKEGEERKRQQMADARQTFMGRKAALRVSVHSRPKERPPKGEMRTHVACKDAKLRVRMLEWRKAKNAEYREALEKVRAGVEGVVFPEGTWFQHFYCGRAREPAGRSIWYELMELD